MTDSMPCLTRISSGSFVAEAQQRIWMRDIPVSISTAVGFIALSGGGAERPGDAFLHSQAAGRWTRPVQHSARRRSDAAASGLDDGAGFIAGIRADGDCDPHRSGSPAPLCDRRHWRCPVFDRAHLVVAAADVLLGAQEGREG